MISVVGVFCEDIREEQQGIMSLIGILPDNIEVPGVPGQLPKMCVYVRIHFDESEDISTIKNKIIFPDGQEIDGDTPDPNVIALAKSASKDAPIVGIVIRVQMAPFVVRSAGIVRVETTVGDRKFLACAINFKVVEAAEKSKT